MGLIGYARVSTAEGRQVLDRQLDALNDAGCERVFEDRASGRCLRPTEADRPAWITCVRATSLSFWTSTVWAAERASSSP